MMKQRPARGLTLIELLTVVAVLGIVLAIAAPSFADLMNRRRVQLVATELSTDLAYARSEAGLRNRRVNLQFQTAGAGMSCYTVLVFDSGLFPCDCTRTPGSACQGGRYELRTVQIPSVKGVSLIPSQELVATSSALEFQVPLLTAWPPTSSVRVRGSRGFELEVQINPVGRVRVCSPDGSFSGVAQC